MGAAEAGTQLLERFIEFVITPAMLLVFGAGFFFFVWGLVQFLWGLNEGANRSEGISHMVWGIAGMLIMVSVQGIIMLLSGTFSLGIGADGSYNPDMSRVESSLFQSP